MRTFAFIPNQVTRAYGGLIKKYRSYDSNVNFAKILAGSIFFVGCVFAYLYFVNLASTRGYFLKKANQNLTTIGFQYEIIKTKLLDYKQQNRDAVQSTEFKRDVVDVSAEVVKIPTNVQLGFVPTLPNSN